MPNRAVTIREALGQGIERLRQHGVESPEVACEILLVQVLKCQRVDLYLNLNQTIPKSQWEILNSWLEQRIKGKPVQYITNSANFFGLDFYVDENVLIPRPETEILVEKVLERLSLLNQPATIIDWGTGSGNIAIALASHLECNVYAVEISEKALSVAERNILTHNLEEKIKLILGDSFTALPKELKGKVDAVVSNPPYVKPEEEGSLPREVREYEPKQALLDKEEGLYFSREIITGAETFLKPKGLLALEVALGQAERVCEIIQNRKSYYKVETVLDLAGVKRVVLAQKK